MAWQKTRSTGMWFLVIGIIGFVISLPPILSPAGTIPGGLTRDQAASCIGISALLVLVGMTILFAAYLSAREALRPVARAKILPLAGSGLVVCGIAWLFVSNYDLSKGFSTRDSTGFDLTVTSTDWTRIDIPLGNSISITAQPGHELYLSTCDKDSYFFEGETVYKINQDGAKGEPTRFRSSCIFLRSRSTQKVGVNYTLLPAK